MIVPTDSDNSNRATRSISQNPLVHDAAQPRASAARAALVPSRIEFPVSTMRAQRWEMRSVLNEVSSLKRLRACGRVPIGPLVSLKTTGDNSSCGYGGLSTCGSVWSCPVCAGKIAAHRKQEVSVIADQAMNSGAVVSLLTLTQRHHVGQSLAELWKALSYAWKRVTSGRRWLEFKAQIGLIGYVKAVEVTHGAHGWHVHIHVLVISERNPRITPIFYQRKQGRARHPYPVEITTAGAFIADRWKAGLAKKNVDFLADRGGMDWQIAKAGDVKAVGQYVAKMGGADSIAAETTLGQFKKARRGNRMPFQILSDFIETGDADDLALWHLWESVSHGKRALTWSKGLREWAKMESEKTDEEIAEEDLQGETIAAFDLENWKALWKIGPAILLDVLQSGGRQAAFDWLIDHQIEFSVPKRDDSDAENELNEDA